MSSLRWHARASSSPSTISAWPYWKRTEGSPSFRRRNDEARDALPGRRRLLAEWPLCGGLAGLGRNEPCLLFEAGDVLVEEIGRGGIRLVDRVVHLAHRAHDLLDRLDNEIDRVVGVDLAGFELGEARGIGNGFHAAIDGGVQCTHPFGEGVRAFACDADDLIEVEVQIAEVRPHEVPVGLLPHELQVDHVNHDALQTIAEFRGGDESRLGAFQRGLLYVCGNLRVSHVFLLLRAGVGSYRGGAVYGVGSPPLTWIVEPTTYEASSVARKT